MKKFLFFAIIASVAVVAMVSCDKDDEGSNKCVCTVTDDYKDSALATQGESFSFSDSDLKTAGYTCSEYSDSLSGVYTCK